MVKKSFEEDERFGTFTHLRSTFFVLENPMTCKISRLLLKDKKMKANSRGIKRFHQSDSGYLSGSRRAPGRREPDSRGHRGEVTLIGKRITCLSAAGRLKVIEVLFGTLLFSKS